MKSVTDLRPRQGIQGLQIIPLDWTTVSAFAYAMLITPLCAKTRSKPRMLCNQQLNTLMNT